MDASGSAGSTAGDALSTVEVASAVAVGAKATAAGEVRAGRSAGSAAARHAPNSSAIMDTAATTMVRTRPRLGQAKRAAVIDNDSVGDLGGAEHGADICGDHTMRTEGRETATDVATCTLPRPGALVPCTNVAIMRTLA